MTDQIVAGTPSSKRAGFWLRALAYLLDVLVVTTVAAIPISLVGAALFASTNGAVQGSYAIRMKSCERLATVPGGLVPPPPAGTVVAADCSLSMFGFTTSRYLIVGESIKQNGDFEPESIHQIYALDAKGAPRGSTYDISWLVWVALVGYWIVREWQAGAPLGKNLMGIRTIDVANPGRRGIPLASACIREAVKLVCYAPVLFESSDEVLSAIGGIPGEPLIDLGGHWIVEMVLALVFLAWIIWLIVDIVRQRDPIYDRLAGTTVIDQR